ncbi:hypothetical protein [Candidatus Methylomicrobium oryzae]|jgi:hypothetical protein|uniref:hypothetical protein n=1 Tax=Candidatus Methylomicrobium oryzae TaxID=2802053 RepID=UPI00192129C7|nr:hypothetical protein [Methylomicrobium sp. RS1]MBL1263342.1 hypothetical protein [Methylomicrobium sp. RS1]
MNKHLKNWLAGISQALVLYPEQDHFRSPRGDFRKDAGILRSDAAKVARGLQKNVNKHGKIDSRLR